MCIKGKDFYSDATFSFVFLVSSVLGKAPKHPEERTFKKKSSAFLLSGETQPFCPGAAMRSSTELSGLM